MYTIITDIVVLLVLLAWGNVCCKAFQIPRGYTPVLGVSAAVVVLHVAGTFGLLWPFSIAFLVVGPLSWVGCFHKTWKIELYSNLMTASIIGFLLACILLEIIYLLSEPFYYQWDEFSHWGIFYKSVYFYHNFSIHVPNEIFVHPSYPQGASALYSVFAVLKREFSERDTYFSLNTALFACSSAIFTGPHKEKGTKIWLTVLAMVGTPFILSAFSFADAKAYTTVYLDIASGAFFGAALCLMCTVFAPSITAISNKQILGMGILCGACVALKDMGMIFTLCVLGIVFLSPIIHGITLKRHKILTAAKTTGLVAVIPIAILLIWKIALLVLDRAQDQFSNMTGFIQSWVKAYHREDLYFYNVLDVLCQRILTGDFVFGKSVFFLGVIFLGFCVAILVYSVKRKLYTLAISNALMPVYCFLYLFVLFYVYICGMSREEGLRLASFERYIGTFFVAWLFLIAFSLLYIGISSFMCPISKVLLAAFLAGEIMNTTYAAQHNDGDYVLSFGLVPWRQNIIAISNNLKSEIQAEPKDLVKVFSLSASDPWPRTYYYRYELWPSMSIQYNQLVEQTNIVDFSFLNAKEDEYLLLFGAEEKFKEQYINWFSDRLESPSNTPEVPILYRVMWADEVATFEICN